MYDRSHVVEMFSKHFTKHPDNLHPVYTPIELCEEILEKIVPAKNKLYFVFYNPEFVYVLKHKYLVPMEQVVLWTHEYSKLYDTTSKMLGCVYLFDCDHEEIGMKFDVVLGNPPFSKEVNGTHKRMPIYNKFFEMATNISDSVAMIMMNSIGATDKQLEDHNKRIESHGWYSLDCTEFFSVRGEQWCVFWDRTKKGSIKATVDVPVLYPERNRLNFIRGNNKFGVTDSKWPGTYTEKKPHYIEVMNRFNSSGIETTFLDPTQTSSSLLKVSDPWFVVTSERADHKDGGWKYIQKVKNSGQQWTSNIYVFPCETEEKADKLVCWLESDEFRSLHKKHSGCSSVSKNRTLPSFE